MSKPRPRGRCPGCSNDRVIFSRGICQPCYKKPAVRNQFPGGQRKRQFTLPPEVRNAILTDPLKTPPGYLEAIAAQVLRKFWFCVAKEDLVQIGWLHLIYAVERWDERVGTNVVAYAHKSVYGRMLEYAMEEANRHTSFTDLLASKPPDYVVLVDEDTQKERIRLLQQSFVHHRSKEGRAAG